MLRMEPEKNGDYFGRSDMLIGYTVIPELWNRVHREGRSDYADITKIGESFCYVKIDGRQGLTNTRFADREDIEDALNDALWNEAIGCQIGAGTGFRYSYVDLAMSDLRKGIDIVRRVLRAGVITRNSWIIQFDQSREPAWVGVWDDSPVPP